MQINQQLVRFNRVLTEKIHKKALRLLVCERKPSINRVKITLKLTEK